MADSDCNLFLCLWLISLIVDDDFIYEDEEEEEPDIDVENGYYNAKGTLHYFSFINSQPSRKTIQKKRSMNSV